MVTRPQIVRLSARIDALVEAANPVAVSYVWQEPGETEQAALERCYAANPMSRAARRTLIFSWLRD